MTLEIIVFIAAILFGIVLYMRESKSNKIYRFFNHLMHSKELQMSEESKKGFVHKQNFLMRLVWVSLFFVITATIVTFVTPINGFYLQYFASAIVGTIIGTYIASFFFVASEIVNTDNIEKKFEEAVSKGKEFVEDLTDSGEENSTKVSEEKRTPSTNDDNAPAKKSARDRLKDKGMIN
jgi:hypothetical protein